jgi:glycine cleavage system transcriptional repressor
MDQIVVVSAVGQDRPGIVAALAKALYELGGNLDDATMTRLHNVFTTMLSAKLPAGKTLDDVRAALAPVAKEKGLSIAVETAEVSSGRPVVPPPDHMLTVYGADKPGIVYKVAAYLAERGINITDMDTRAAGTSDAPVYVMLLEVTAGERDIDGDLAALKADLGVDITVQYLDTEAL